MSEPMCAWCFVQPQEIGVHCRYCWADLNDAAGTYDDEKEHDDE